MFRWTGSSQMRQMRRETGRWMDGARSTRFPSLRWCGDFEPRNPRQIVLLLRGDPIGKVCEKSALQNASIYVSWTFVVKMEHYTCRWDRDETNSGSSVVVSGTQAHGYFKIQNKGRHPARQTRCESGKKEQGSHTFWEPNNLLFIKTNECNKINEN